MLLSGAKGESNSSEGFLEHSSPDITLTAQGVKAFSNDPGSGVGGRSNCYSGGGGVYSDCSITDWGYVERVIYTNYGRK
jgi:hypothetical protein